MKLDNSSKKESEKMEKTELVFIPLPGLSHLISAVEAAKLLLQRDHRLSITFVIFKFPNNILVDTYTQEISSDLRIIHLPIQKVTASETFVFDVIESQIPSLRNVLSELIRQSSARIAGIVVDMFCTRLVDIADEFGLPCYVFFTSSACFLGLFSHLTSLKLEHNLQLTQYHKSDAELSVPCLSIKVPAKVLPVAAVTEGPLTELAFDCFKRYSRIKGVLVNTFYELESYAIRSLSNGKGPKVYPVGPILNLNHQLGSSDNDEIKKWLDRQPDSSVVFLCFGSRGSLEVPQLKEMASALERCGHRFLWSIRKPPPKGTVQLPTDYEDFDDILPEGFLERTEGRGKLIGWAPQIAVLSHPAVGGFVSHCGWNSTLESVWCGVPVATFPLRAEQQLNAFQLVKEFKMAEAIRVDYNKDSVGPQEEEEIVGSEEIEAAIRRLMEADGRSGVREKVRKMQKESRLAVEEGGSSYNTQISFIEDVINNIG